MLLNETSDNIILCIVQLFNEKLENIIRNKMCNKNRDKTSTKLYK